MGAYSVIIFLLIVCWLAQIGLSYFQHKDYHRVLNQIKQRKDGYLGVGVAKAKFQLGKGVVALLVTDAQGTILDYQEMSGYTVFARFKEQEGCVGKQKEEALENLKGKQRIRAFNQALELIEQEKMKS